MEDAEPSFNYPKISAYRFQIPHYNGNRLSADETSKLAGSLRELLADTLRNIYNSEHFNAGKIKVKNAEEPSSKPDGKVMCSKLPNSFKIQYEGDPGNIGDMVLSENGSNIHAEIRFNGYWPLSRSFNLNPTPAIIEKIQQSLEWRLI